MPLGLGDLPQLAVSTSYQPPSLGERLSLELRHHATRDRELADRAARGDPPDRVGTNANVLAAKHDIGNGEPEVAVRTGRDPDRDAVCCRDRELADRAAGGDPPDHASAPLGEPEVAVRAGRDPDRDAVRCRYRELADRAGRGDSPDLAGADVGLGEPEVAVRTGGDPGRPAFRCRYRELADRAGRGDSPDLAAFVLGEPEVAVRTGGDRFWPVRCRDRELADRAAGGDPPDLTTNANAIAAKFTDDIGHGHGKPEVAVRAGGDRFWRFWGAGTARKQELTDPAAGGDPPDLASALLGEPEVAVGTVRDRFGDAFRSRGRGGDRELPD